MLELYSRSTMSYFYSATVSHPGLGRSKLIKAATQSELRDKVATQSRIWNDLYKKRCDVNARRQLIANKAAHLEDAQSEAEARTVEAQQTLDSIRGTLVASLRKHLSFSWDAKANNLPFPVAQPEVAYHSFPAQPDPKDPEYIPHFGLLDKVIGPLHEKKISEAQTRLQQAMDAWQSICARIGKENDALEADYLVRMENWKSEKHSFESRQATAVAAANLKQERYLAGSAPEVVEFNSEILKRSTYPDYFEKSFDLDYNGANRVLTIECDLPAFADLPKLQSVKYVTSQDSFSEADISDKAAVELYTDFVYQVCLRTIHELIDADVRQVLNGFVFNGYVSATNPATGNVDRACVLALATVPKAVTQLNLARVDPEECFTSLGGRSSDPFVKYRPVIPANAESLPTEAVSKWISSLKQRVTSSGGILVISFQDLQNEAGLISATRANIADGRTLVSLLGDAGLAVEPDASLLAQAYRPTDALAVYSPANPSDLKASANYQGAAGVLAMCGLVAIADGQLEPDEIGRTWDCVADAFKLTSPDRLRFESLLKALLRNADCLWRALPKVVAQLKPEFKEWAAEVAVYVAIRNGVLADAERSVLDRIFQSIGIAAETQRQIIGKYVAAAPEVTVLHADPQPIGEKINVPSFGLKLDMNRVAAISRETKEVVAKLSSIMEEKDVKAEATEVPVVALVVPNGPAPLNPNYTGVYQQLISKPEWTKADFVQLAGKYKLMPVAVTDVINAWAEDALGDFLIQGDDPVIIQTELLPAKT
jgi:tellurite resistance protein